MSLADLGRRRFVSQSALAELLKELSELDQLPSATSRSSVKRAREEKLDIKTPVGPLFIQKVLPSSQGQQRITVCEMCSFGLKRTNTRVLLISAMQSAHSFATR